LEALLEAGYKFMRFDEHNSLKDSQKTAFIRHDIDARPTNASRLAEVEATYGIRGSYYFRAGEKLFNTAAISFIEELGHEIGYHYENMDTCSGLIDEAYKDFVENLEKFRSVVAINTICMHGSPLSRWNNIDLWNRYSYHDLGIRLEVFRDIDYTSSLYLTDTGRSWNGGGSILRDKVVSDVHAGYKKTDDIIFDASCLTERLYLTVHPQRWTDDYFMWILELVSQSIKNPAKYILRKYRSGVLLT
jgi:hypothetical protein